MCRISMAKKKIPEVKTSIGTDKPLQTVKTQISIVIHRHTVVAGYYVSTLEICMSVRLFISRMLFVHLILFH